jgi:SAM-dependent methyltransferase
MNMMVDLGKALGLVNAPMVDSVAGFMRGRTLIEANNFGVFQILEKGPATAAEVAEQTKTAVNGMEILLTALVTCGYLKKSGDRYRNGRWVKTWILDSGLGMTHTLKLHMNVWDRATSLGECVRLGHPVNNPHETIVRDPGQAAEYYVRGMRPIARMMIPYFAPKVILPPGAKRLVDLGGSHGESARAVCRRQPGLEGWVYDLAGPADAARRLAEQEGDKSPVKFEAKDLLADDLGKDWDVALMISVLHVFDPEQARKIFQKVAAGLKPGGTFAVVDHLRGVSKTRDNVAAMMGVSWLTVGGQSYTLTEAVDLVKAAGFRDVRVTKLAMRIGSTMVQGIK